MYCLAVNNLEHWREQTRQLLMRGIAPQNIAWQHTTQHELLFSENADNFTSQPIKIAQPKIPREFIQLIEEVACYRDNKRWALLYSLAWRLVFENKHLLECKLDPEVNQALSMRKAVNRDKHKMKAFVRFKQVAPGELEPPSSTGADTNTRTQCFVAWFEPSHLIVAATSAFFVKRFHNMPWSILTPDTCAHWNLETLQFSPGIPRPKTQQDELEELWKTYYANIFNPARLKLKAMQSEMPKKYWRNLPEAPLIAELTRNAGGTSQAMLNKPSETAWKKTAKSKLVQQQQASLRGRHKGKA